MNLSGIYMIVTDVSEKFYIGSAIVLDSRFRQHINTLKRNCHPNAHLQNVWNKHADCTFRFFIIENCTKEILIEREQYWINILKPEYNKNPTAGSRYGVTLSKETRIKISKSLKGISHTSERKKYQASKQIGLKRPSKRDIINWPHLDGHKCKCLDCDAKRKNYRKKYWETYER